MHPHHAPEKSKDEPGFFDLEHRQFLPRDVEFSRFERSGTREAPPVYHANGPESDSAMEPYSPAP